MTEHSEPRRWMLNRYPPSIGSQGETVARGDYLEDGERVYVRQDACCEADVEAVAQMLAEVAPDGDMFTRRAWCRAKARSLLSTIFKDG